HGSRAYGLARPNSDHDYKGIIVGPPAWYLGFQGGPEQVELGPDHMHFELRKFMRLAAQGNPTLIECLFTDPADHTVVTPAGQRLLDARHAFLSKRVQGSFGGYAISQLKRIRTHRRWLLTPPATAPRRSDFGLPEHLSVPRDQLGAAEALLARGEPLDLPPNFMAVLDAERRYRGAKQEWQQFQTWQRQRNPKRAALEAQHGYDTKHALHLVRLLRMGAEILRTGTVQVRRPDREELLAIRDGAWDYDTLLTNAQALHAEVQAAARTSTLPEQADEAALDALCVAIVHEVLRP
ncbi:MAG: nucleotidyltransferase domain-containing protein, partial [Myxococcales bacterium]|nr:nucleotidyltransferase domain-containing protein [Myxococcales bacterium]